MLDALPATRLDQPQRGPAPADEWCGVPCGSRPVWCAVVTHVQAERRAHASLHRYGFEAYLPLVTIRRPCRHYHTGPLFPRYVFVRLDLTRPWHPVIAAPGVFQLVTFNGTKPATCSDAVVRAVREAVDGFDAFSAAEPLWKPGQPCSLALGPLAGMPAVVTQVGADMATVALLMFGHLREITVQLDALQPRTE